jgi:RNA 2',3'-cyclic 3'-phosphodiesterase
MRANNYSLRAQGSSASIHLFVVREHALTGSNWSGVCEMSETIRCFLAVKVSADAPLRRVLRQLSEMGRALKAVDPGSLHVTLKFFAEAESQLIPEMRAIATVAAARQIRSELSLAGLGVFPHIQRPSVIWAGLEGPGLQTLCVLAQDLDRSLEALGFPSEDRPFAPHLTLARVKAKPPPELRELLARNSRTVFGAAPVDEIELIRSELGPEGPRYTVLDRCSLADRAT